MNKKNNITLVAGGTGGHFFSALSLAYELTERGYNIIIITEQRCAKYVDQLQKDNTQKNKNIKFHIFNISCKLGFFDLPKTMFTNLIVLIKSYCLFIRKSPNIVIGFGGYNSFTPLLAAFLLNKKIGLHEQNMVLGRANNLMQKYASLIALQYPNTKNINISDEQKQNLIKHGHIKTSKTNIVTVEADVRPEIKNINLISNHKINDKTFTITIIGGSQGASFITNIMHEIIAEIVKNIDNIQLKINQQISQDIKEFLEKTYSNLGINFYLSEFFYDIADIYKNTDLLIARAGASTIAEIQNMFLPAILIPLPSAKDNHQYYNAKSLENYGGCWCYEQNQMTKNLISNKIIELINNQELLLNAKNSIKKYNNSVKKLCFADTVNKLIT